MNLLKNFLQRTGYKKKKNIFPDSSLIKIAADFTIGKYRNIQVNSKAKITISENVLFREFCSILVTIDGKLTINKNVFFNNYCSINCFELIEIGESTLFGEGVKIYDHNHEYQYEQKHLKVERNKFKTSPVKIGANCWIGSNVTILKGVIIGDNVIIGAGNLIYKSVEAGSVIKFKQEALIS